LQQEKISFLMEIPYMQSTGYLARATVNTVLKGGHIANNLNDNSQTLCKIQ